MPEDHKPACLCGACCLRRELDGGDPKERRAFVDRILRPRDAAEALSHLERHEPHVLAAMVAQHGGGESAPEALAWVAAGLAHLARG